MSPKKRKRRKSHGSQDRPETPSSTPGDAEQGRVAPGTTPDKRPLKRTPVAVASPPDRRVTALWVLLWALWALGTPLALAGLLFTGLDGGVDPADPRLSDPETAAEVMAEQQRQAVRAMGNALVWLLVMAWGVPLVGTVLALVVRRRMAALCFAVALALSVALLLLVAPPAELWDALSAHLFG
ncbi:hypothetical protein [Nocardiopsis sp. MG754419]|uniref:hypothetical protein n=1 Tax=Nocardiopsis sp. MG754419 TaxID=2259865 RepID=UPI001BAAA254|nr:hypothetical protein [Nocardiopsis sp. MG754419]MBR8745079.1 hypothetical protein [Nocardiopsis sp. MG754419]